jgi:hypothetical protein
MGRLRFGLFAFVVSAGLGWSASPARAEVDVDLALVLAVDVSFSMDHDEQTLQRDGFVQAFQSPAVKDAIRKGLLGRIGVTYVEWAGAADQKVLVPWAVLDSPESIDAFAGHLASLPTRRASRTSISGAIDFGVKLLAESGLAATRQVIDVSGDGPNNQGRPVVVSRSEAVAKGITINGLPLMLKMPGYFDVPELDSYYRDCVIGGVGAFLVPARSREQFRDAIRTKVIMEVAGLRPYAPLVQTAQVQAGGSDCLIGETQWRDRMAN